MTLSDDAVLDELRGWKRFVDALPEGDRTLIAEALELGREYYPAIQARDALFTAESLFMSLLLAQHKEIARLAAELERLGVHSARMDT